MQQILKKSTLTEVIDARAKATSTHIDAGNLTAAKYGSFSTSTRRFNKCIV